MYCLSKVLRILLLLISISSLVSGQKAIKHDYDVIYGKWKVTEYVNLMNRSDSTMRSKDSAIVSKCLPAIITIDKKQIVIEPKKVCEFIPCYPLKISGILEMPLITDKTLYYQFDGAEIVEYNKVGQGFLNLIGSKENKLRYFDTNCLCGNFTYTLKIILVNEKKIVLFSGVDILVLSKN